MSETKPKRYIEGVENVDYVECKICQARYTSLINHLVLTHKTNKAEYTEKYNSPICSEVYLKKCSDKSWMKEDRAKEFKEKNSLKFKGVNNPSHKSKVNRAERKSRSPYSIEFYNKRFPDNTQEEREQMLRDTIERIKEKKKKNNSISTTVEYYTSRGFTQEEAEKKLKERQNTFTLEKCIAKHGEEKGRLVWQERQDKWKGVMQDKYEKGEYKKLNKTNSSSKVCNDFVEELANLLDLEIEEYSSFNNNGELGIFNTNEKKWHFYDFLHIPTKTIIEFHGDRFHGNPLYYKADDKIPFGTAGEKWLADEKKQKYAESLGYNHLVVWENDYRKNPTETLQKCSDFIKDKLNLI